MMRVAIESHGVTQALVRNKARLDRLADLGIELEQGMREIQDATAEWMMSEGHGSWPALAASTVEAKTRAGAEEPERALYEFGNLFQSVTTSSGPYSFVHRPTPESVVFGVDWDVGGWQIAVVLSEGTDNAGASGTVRIPPRPIWPPPESAEMLRARAAISDLLLKGI